MHQTAATTREMTWNRRRTHTFSERQEFPLRLPQELYAQLTAACEKAGMTTTGYVSTVLELAILDPVSAEAAESFAPHFGRGETRVHVAMRMAPSLYAGVQKAAKAAGWSMNRYVNWAIWSVLQD